MRFHRRHVLTMGAASAAAAVLPQMARAALPVEAYAALPLVDQIALSPDGKRIALISQNQDNKVLIYLDVVDQVAKAIPLGTVKTRNLMWADNDHVVVQTSQTLGRSRYRWERGLVTNINLTTGQKTLLFGKDSARHQFHPTQAGWPTRVRTKGGYQLLATARSQRDRVIIQRLGMDDPSGTMAYEGSEYLSDCICTPEGRIIAIVEASETYGFWRLKFNRAVGGETPDFQEVYSVNSRNPESWPWLVGQDRSGDGRC